jgi:hypothetical protein
MVSDLMALLLTSIENLAVDFRYSDEQEMAGVRRDVETFVTEYQQKWL